MLNIKSSRDFDYLVDLGFVIFLNKIILKLRCFQKTKGKILWGQPEKRLISL
jgi:hypothetical protein